MGPALICLDENSALDFLSGRLPAPLLAETERHLGGCGACVELLARSAPFLPSRDRDSAASSSHRVSPAVPTLAMQPLRRESPPPRTIEGESAAGAMAHDSGEDTEGPPTLEAGTLLKDTYRVIGLIGRGGMGEVYEVTHARLAGRYALKLLPPAFAHEHVSVTRFRREADITSALRHPNIVQVIDFDHTPAGQPFLVMEFLAGGDLSQLMVSRGPMPLPLVLKIVAQIVSALAAVHRKGIVHRDLKPQNVLLVRDDDLAIDRVKLVDFGLSKRSGTSLLGISATISRERTLLGTPRYMAPEQASGRIDEIDAKTDQFALGAMVYEMLTGVSAFNGEHIALLLYRIVSEEPVSLRELVPELPEHVERAVSRAMSKQKSDRFPTTNDFFEALSGAAAASGTEDPLEASSERGGRTPGRSSERATVPADAEAREERATTALSSTSASLAASMEALGRGRRRRVAAFALGVGVAMIVAVSLRAFRSQSTAVPTGVEHRTTSTTPPSPPLRAPEAPPATAPREEDSIPPTPPRSEVGAPDAAAIATIGAIPSRREDDAVVRRARPPKHRAIEAKSSPASAPAPASSSISDNKATPTPPKPPVGRLVEDL